MLDILLCQNCINGILWDVRPNNFISHFKRIMLGTKKEGSNKCLYFLKYFFTIFKKIRFNFPYQTPKNNWEKNFDGFSWTFIFLVLNSHHLLKCSKTWKALWKNCLVIKWGVICEQKWYTATSFLKKKKKLFSFFPPRMKLMHLPKWSLL